MKCYKSFFVAIALGVMVISCDSQSGESSISYTTKPPLPPLSSQEQKLCDSLKRFAYESLNQNNCILVYNDTIKDETRHLRFVQVLKEKFHLDYYRTYDIDNYETRSIKFCIQPIMDSFIIAMYGMGAKDSIINLAYSSAL